MRMTLFVAASLLQCGLLYAESTVTLSGTVTGPQEAVVEGASLKLYRMQVNEADPSQYSILAAGETKSDVKGQFSFTVQEANEQGYSYYMAIACKEGLSYGWKTLLDRNGALDIRLTEPQKMIGFVQDTEGKAVAGAEVRLAFLTSQEGQFNFAMGLEPVDCFKTTTCEQGRFEFSNLPEGASAEILVRKEGRGILQTLSGDPDFQNGLTYKAGQTDIMLTMHKPCSITGIVMTKDKQQPTQGIKIALMQEQIPLSMLGIKPVVSGADGTFQVDGVPPGKYTLRVVDNADWFADPVNLEVSGTIGTRIELVKGGTLEVKVVDDATGQAVQDAAVTIILQSSNQVSNCRTDASGLARKMLPAGNYDIRAFKGGYRSSGSGAVAVVENEKTSAVEIRMGGQARLKGVVKKPDGTAAKGVKIQVFPSHGYGSGGDILTDAEGRFDLAWNPEDTGWSEGDFLFSAFDPGSNLAKTEHIDEQAKEVSITLQPGCRVKGTVLNEDGKPLKDASTRLTIWGANWGTSFGQEIKTDAKGQYVFTSLPAEQKFSVNVSGVKGYGSGNSSHFTTEPGEEGTVLEDIKLRVANLTLSGQAVDVEGKALANVDVYMNGEGQPNENAKTDKDGNFKFEHVCAGSVYLNANLQTGGSYIHGNLRTEGGAQDVKVVLTAQGSYTRYEPKQPAPLLGKDLPDLSGFGVEVPADANSVLVFVWDMQQRPSRHFVKELASQKERLESKGIHVVLLNASKVEKEPLDKWLAENQIPFACGIMAVDPENAAFNLGVQGLPWMILINSEQRVTAEGFSMDELAGKMEQL